MNSAQMVDDVASQREDWSLEQHIDHPVRREQLLNSIKEEQREEAALSRFVCRSYFTNWFSAYCTLYMQITFDPHRVCNNNSISRIHATSSHSICGYVKCNIVAEKSHHATWVQCRGVESHIYLYPCSFGK